MFIKVKLFPEILICFGFTLVCLKENNRTHKVKPIGLHTQSDIPRTLKGGGIQSFLNLPAEHSVPGEILHGGSVS